MKSYSTSSFLEQSYKQQSFHKERIRLVYDFPASRQLAQKHNEANTFGYNLKHQGSRVCACCYLPTDRTKFNICQRTTPSLSDGQPVDDKIKKQRDMFKLDSGTSMFFTFIKMAIIFLLLRFLITDMYNMISSMSASYCMQHPSQCSGTISKLSAFNKNTAKDEHMVNVVDILNLISVLVSISFLTYYRGYQLVTYSIAEMTSLSQDDYSLFVEDIPIFLSKKQLGSQISYKKILQEAFEKKINKWIQTVVLNSTCQRTRLQKDLQKLVKAKAKEEDLKQKPKVRSISLCFDLTQIKRMDDLRLKLMAQYISKLPQDNNMKQSHCDLVWHINKINDQYIELSKRFASEQSSPFNMSPFLGKAFISFEYQHYREFLMRDYLENNLIYTKQKPLKLSLASQPSDVYWQNMGIDDDERPISIIKSYLVLIMALTFSFAALLGLQLLQQMNAPQQTTTTNPQTSQNSLLSHTFTLLMTILINVINYILTVTIQILTQSQKHKCKTDQITSLVIKNVVSQFFNTAIIYYILSVMNPQIGPLTQNGIVVKIISLVAVSGVVNIFMNILQIEWLIKCLLNKWKYKEQPQENVFQVQLNQDFQDPEFNFAQRYAYYIMQVYVASFYACIAPPITIILALIFAVQYWIDKANLFYRCSCPTDFNFRLPRLTLKIFSISILVFAVSNLIFMPEVHYSEEQVYHFLNWITFGIALVYVAIVIFMPLPNEWIQRLFYDGSIQKKSYTECMEDQNFNKAYWRTNPATCFTEEKDLNKPDEVIVHYSSIRQQDFQMITKENEPEPDIPEDKSRKQKQFACQPLYRVCILRPLSGGDQPQQ